MSMPKIRDCQLRNSSYLWLANQHLAKNSLKIILSSEILTWELLWTQEPYQSDSWTNHSGPCFPKAYQAKVGLHFSLFLKLQNTWNMSHTNHFNYTFMVRFYCYQQRMHANTCNLYMWHPPPANHFISISKWVPRQLVTTDVELWPQEGDIDQTDLSRSVSVEHGTGNGFRLIRFWSICVATLFT